MKGNLTREEQDELSAKLAVMGVDMTWNGMLAHNKSDKIKAEALKLVGT